MKIEELKNEKLGICVSGGLDSKTVAAECVELGLDVLCFSADLGQPDEEDISSVSTKVRRVVSPPFSAMCISRM